MPTTALHCSENAYTNASLINNCHFKEEKHERRIIRAIFKIIFTHVIIFSANAILNVFIPLRGHDLGATNTVIE